MGKLRKNEKSGAGLGCEGGGTRAPQNLGKKGKNLILKFIFFRIFALGSAPPIPVPRKTKNSNFFPQISPGFLGFPRPGFFSSSSRSSQREKKGGKGEKNFKKKKFREEFGNLGNFQKGKIPILG